MKTRYSRGAPSFRRARSGYWDAIGVLATEQMCRVVQPHLCTRTYGILGYRTVSRIGCIRLLRMTSNQKEYMFWYNGTLRRFDD